MKKISIVVLIIGIFLVFGGKLDNSPQVSASNVLVSNKVALVNNDQTQDYLEDKINFGNSFIQGLENAKTSFDYEVVSSTNAMQGMESGKYAAMVTLPSDLTMSIISINSEKPQEAVIKYEVNSKLSDKKRLQLEKEISALISTFEDGVTYMYIYEIFDNLHTTQEGLSVVMDNQAYVYAFLEEILGINIVSNHQYELKELNSEQFDQIDISEQLTEINAVVKQYDQAIGESISVFQEESKGISQEINNSEKDYKQNTDALNDRIKNIDDSLQTVVEENEIYTEEEYTITNTCLI